MSDIDSTAQEEKRRATLSRLSLQNWKSIITADVSFKPLTLLVGQNSVGKSSFFQALLSLAQWSATGSKAHFPLNGDIVRLGKFSDTLTKIINSSAKDPTSVSIGIHIGGNSVSIGLVPGDKVSSASIQTFEANLSASSLALIHTAQGLQFKFNLDSQWVSTSYVGEWESNFSLEFESLRRDLLLDKLPKEISLLNGLGALAWEGGQSLQEVIAEKLKIIASAMILASKRFKEKPNLVSINTYLTKVLNRSEDGSGLVSAEDFVKLLDNEIQDVIQYVEISPHASNDLLFQSRIESALHSVNFAQLVLPDLGVNTEQDSIGSEDSTSLRVHELLEEIETFVTHTHFYDVFGYEDPTEFDEDGEMIYPRGIPEVLVSESFRNLPFLNCIAWHGDGLDYPVEIRTPQSVLEDDLKTLSSDISGKISYLGPLRVNGYSSALLGSSRNEVFPVGESGELTPLLIAELLSETNEREYPVFGQGIKTCSFREALESWFGHFTIPGAPLQIVDLDKHGIQVQVASRSLDRFGTGASQVLPILALVLSRKPGEVVLIEQPELHLHPGGQQYLADLFMAASSMGIQLVLETHSEYIVNRIRRGVVLEFIESDDVQIVNFEQDSKGLAQVTCVNLTESGGFADWPRGFFANTESDLLDIIKALEAREAENP